VGMSDRLTISQIAENLIDSAIRVAQPVTCGGIYILYRDSKAVYVGQTCDLSTRLYSHKKKVIFDVVMFFPEEDKETRKIFEKILIVYLKTTLNVKGKYLNWYDYRRLARVMRRFTWSAHLVTIPTKAVQ
jgi:hypothetical protein